MVEGLYGKIDAFAPEEAGLWIVRVIKAHGVPCACEPSCCSQHDGAIVWPMNMA